MVKRIAIAELEGVALDWAVNVAQSGANGIGMDDVARKLCLTQGAGFHPSTDWSQCGPLIERYKVDLEHFNGDWRAEMWEESCNRYVNMSDGKTPIVAACRAIVAAHNPSGFVEVPDELLEECQ